VAVATGGNGGFAEFGTGGSGGQANATATSTAIHGGAANATAAATGGNGTFFAQERATGVAGVANANSFATTINGNAAQAQSTAMGSGGQAEATAQTNFGNLTVQTGATSPVNGTGASPAVATAQAGGAVSLSTPISAGQAFSVTTGFASGPSTVTVGSMGAGYGGVGTSAIYQETANFIYNGGSFMLDLLNSSSLGAGLDSAEFQILLNGNIFESESFDSLAAAEAFFSNNLIDISSDGLSDIGLIFDETMSSAGGFAFDYATLSTTPLPSSWTMMLTGLASFGMLLFYGKRRAASRL
jgi:hypothetical protein